MRPISKNRKIIVQNIILAIMLAGGLFVRWYRLGDLLGFYYDQGRDAMVIRKLFTERKFFLVGPVTGLDGIFLGPTLYYLLAPFYSLGKGNPVAPAMFLSALHLPVIYLLFRLGKKVSVFTGFLAAFIYSFSQPIFWLNRWLSNPPPVMLGSSLLIYSLYKITKGASKYWLLVAVAIGFSLQFEVASAIFFIPAVLVFLSWQWQNRPPVKTAAVAIFIFLSSLLPQTLFELRHDFVMSKSLRRELTLSKSFSGYSPSLFLQRIRLFEYSFGNKIFTYQDRIIILGLPAIIIYALITFRKWRSPLTTILLIILFSQLVPLLFFQGNHGNIYDYHLSGNFPVFILLTAIVIGVNISRISGKIFALVFIITFIKTNFPLAVASLSSGVDGPTHVSLGNQKQAIQWLLQDSNGSQFNVDVYVPPVIPYAYDYLLAWVGDIQGIYQAQEQVSLLYTVYEQDPPHPERLESWMVRKSTIGKIEKSVSFGGITVDRRSRLTSTK